MKQAWQPAGWPYGRASDCGLHPIGTHRGPTHCECHMKSSTKDQAAGTAKVIAGDLKELTGKVIGNPGLQAKGKAEQAVGHTQKKVGEIKKVLGV